MLLVKHIVILLFYLFDKIVFLESYYKNEMWPVQELFTKVSVFLSMVGSGGGLGIGLKRLSDRSMLWTTKQQQQGFTDHYVADDVILWSEGK